MPKDYLLIGVDLEGKFSIRFLCCNKIINQVLEQKRPSPTLKNHLAQFLMAAALLGSRSGDRETTLFKLKNENPLLKINCEISPRGAIRCAIFPPEHRNIKLDQLQGEMNVAILKQNQDIYESIILIEGSDILLTMQEFLKTSSQTDSILCLNIDYESGQKNFGFWIERLPQTADADWKAIYDHLQDGKILAELCAQTDDPDKIVSGLFKDQFKIMAVLYPELTCSCSKEKFIEAVKLLPQNDLLDLFMGNKGVISQCEYCQTIWEINDKELREILGMVKMSS